MRILVSCVGGELMPQFLSFLKNNKEKKVFIVGLDKNSNAIGKYFCDKFYQISDGKSKDYIETLVNIVKNEKISLIIPASDEEALKVSKNKNIFDKLKVRIACTDYKTLKILNDKEKTYKFLEENGYNLANWTVTKTETDLILKVKDFYKKFGAVVIKPVSGRGGRDVFFVNKKNRKQKTEESENTTFNGINDFIKRFNNFTFPKKCIVMEKLKGPVCDIDMLSWNGTAVSVICRRRIHENFPNQGHKIIEDKKLINLGKKIINDFKLSWLYDCDVMFKKNGEPIPIEINPRQSGSIAISLNAGSNIISNIIRIYQGKAPIRENKNLSKYVLPFKSLKNIKSI